jgi:hypothetical protein
MEDDQLEEFMDQVDSLMRGIRRMFYALAIIVALLIVIVGMLYYKLVSQPATIAAQTLVARFGRPSGGHLPNPCCA